VVGVSTADNLGLPAARYRSESWEAEALTPLWLSVERRIKGVAPATLDP
jgi:hypothetical protein